MISYNSQATKGDYKIQFETDDYIAYQQVQHFIRELIDKNETRSKNIKEEKENPFKTEWCLLPV